MSKKTFNDNNHITNYVKKVGMSKIYKILTKKLDNDKIEALIFWNKEAYIQWENNRVYGILRKAL
jgi:dissimilatory sulfite reductase (desulfoviridin) alpha/beta subunit